MFSLQFPRILLLAVFCSIFSLSWSQAEERDYVRAKINATAAELSALTRAGVATDHVETVSNGIVGEFSNWEMQQIDRLGLHSEILIPDVPAYYQARNYLATATQRTAGIQSVPAGFNLGSMGGHLTYAEAIQELDSMRMMYPNLVTPMDSIGASIEGRPIWMVKISNVPGVDETEPEVLYVGLHHAREPMSLMNLIYFMQYLLENYGSDPLVTYLVDNRELYFVPILNPDGYVFNETTHPNGGGMWRKNRHANGSSVVGVDLNRNYSYAWGFDNVGSSPDPNAPTYRGVFPFSEPETQALRQFCGNREFRTALNYHAWGNSMINPWGYDRNAPLQNVDQFHRYGAFMTESNEYLVGNPFQTLGYAANGTSDDWMYGDLNDKPRIMAFTPEVGDATDWFWPVAPRIAPLCAAQLEANLRIACLAGACIDAKPETACELEGSVVRLPMRFTNFGLEAGAGFASYFSSWDPNIIGVPIPQLNLPALGTGQEIVDSFAVALAPNIPTGTVIRGVVRTVFPSSITLQDTIEFIYGVPDIIFSERGEGNLSNWTGNWARTNEKAYTGSYSITDSPNSLYQPNANSTLTLQTPLDLSDYTDVKLRYRTNWELESEWDYVEVRASTDGTVWTPLQGVHTRPGNGNHQPFGEPLYDGAEYDWVLEKIDLSAYDGQDLYLRFVLISNGNQQRDGFFFDDLVVTGTKIITDVEPPSLESLHLFPNPGEGRFRIGGRPDGLTPITLHVYSVMGQELLHMPVDLGQQVDLSQLAAGVYLYAFEDADHRAAVHKLILR